MVRLYIAKAEDVSPEGLPLSEYRKNRLSRLVREEDRRESITAELLLNFALRGICDAPLNVSCGEKGKPFIKGCSRHFSLSHSGGRVLCAVAEVPLGADIQKTGGYKPAVVRRFFAPEEQEYIARAEDRDLAFTSVWALKESYIKATGEGLSCPLNSFSVVNGGEIGLPGFGLDFFTIDGYCIAVCVPGHNEFERELIFPDWSELVADKL